APARVRRGSRRSREGPPGRRLQGLDDDPALAQARTLRHHGPVRRWQPRVRRLAASEEPGLMETAILTLLEQNESLGYEQIALYLDKPPEQVRRALTSLRRRRFGDVLGVSEVVGHTTAAVAYWRLTELGPKDTARLRSR